MSPSTQFLEFLESPLDQGPSHEAGEVDSLGKASPSGGIRFKGAVQDGVEEV